MELSFTRFRVYLECPWKYKLMFVDGERIPPTPASSLGQTLHRTLERFHRAGGAGLEDLLEFYGGEWLSAGFKDPETGREFYEKGRRMLEKYFEREKERRTRVVGIEKEFVYPLGRHTVRGMIDRLDLHPDGRHELIDYKTQFDIEKAGPIADNIQLRFYALGLRECLSVTPAWLTIHYLAAGRRESVPYDILGEEELKGLILETADKIEAGKFAPDTSFCPRCGLRKTCALSAARD